MRRQDHALLLGRPLSGCHHDLLICAPALAAYRWLVGAPPPSPQQGSPARPAQPQSPPTNLGGARPSSLIPSNHCRISDASDLPIITPILAAELGGDWR